MAINFKPWIGKNYEKSMFEIPILIMGESHWQWKEDVGGPLTTINFIQENVDGDWRHDQMKRVFKTFLNDDFTDENIKKFWHSVAYYNYIQEIVGGAPECRPTAKMWKDGEECFLEILEQLKPRCLVVFGVYFFRKHMPQGEKGPKLMIGDEERDTRKYLSGNSPTLASSVHHFTRMSPKRWRPWVHLLIDEAKKI
jgi:hypothetical protein